MRTGGVCVLLSLLLVANGDLLRVQRSAKKYSVDPMNSDPRALLLHTDGIAQVHPGLGRPTGRVQKMVPPEPGKKVYEAAPAYDSNSLKGNSPTRDFVTVTTNYEPLRMKRMGQLIRQEAEEEAEAADNEKMLLDQRKSQHCENCKNKVAPTPTVDMLVGPGATKIDPRPNAQNLQNDLKGISTKDNNHVNVVAP